MITHTALKGKLLFRANGHQPMQQRAVPSWVDNRPTAVKQRIIQQAASRNSTLTAQPQITQQIVNRFNSSTATRNNGQIIQREVIDGSTRYSSSQIYKRYKTAFDQAGVAEDDLIDFVDEYDDVSLEELFRKFKVKATVDLEDDDPCDEEIRVGKEKERTSAPARKYQKLYNTSTFRCEEPTCFHSSRTITLNTDGTEQGYANKHGRQQAPPVAHHKDAPANVRIGAFNEVVRSFLKQKGRSFDALKINSRFKAIRKRVEWTSKLGRHHQSHTTCNLRNKDITWTTLSKNNKQTMLKNVRAYLKTKRYLKELNSL